jgi:hypothetical protein
METALTDVYRVEDHLGLGPYITSNWKDRGLSVPDWVFDMQADHANENHPCPQEDGLGWPDESEVCALSTLEALEVWFQDWEEQLAEAGFHIARYAVPLHTARFGMTDRGQVVFMRDRDLRPQEIIPIWM